MSFIWITSTVRRSEDAGSEALRRASDHCHREPDFLSVNNPWINDDTNSVVEASGRQRG